METEYLVYDHYQGTIAFSGTKEQCMEFILAQATRLTDGRIIYRTWTENGAKCYDVGRVYALVAAY